MKKSELDNHGIVEEWIQSAGRDRAPEGFSQNVMARVEVEPVTNIDRYSSPLGKSFKIGSLVVYGLLIIASLFIPSQEGRFLSIFSSIKLPEINFPAISLPEFNLPDYIKPEYLIPLALGLTLLFLFDRFLSSLFKSL